MQLHFIYFQNLIQNFRSYRLLGLPNLTFYVANLIAIK
jgi:hypothetical protein